MDLVYEKSSEKSLEKALESLEKNLKDNNFGVLWKLNFKDKLEEKGLEFKDDFVVLEVCNPKQAKDVLEINIHIGYILPCKMVVRSENNKTYIGMTRPEKLIGLFDIPKLDSVAKEVEKSLKNAIELSI
ncbi:DUF302 domain-containing protein [Senegalia massiliensis]|uniref:DUF302 domain-containing protein n=1 Tax=Senegalia massiliensis TaxID=1720316 RepID=A0A845QZR2_9CLOT|nr:DUF302 domain-containing protein [Senegalia massiliensis]NBI06678.1 DUF302 domain-containing protein [Senegalia massiliensis]